ncbi:hypothetical protein CRYUN_Cryun17cG0133600 [Craigia yunnanensis]
MEKSCCRFFLFLLFFSINGGVLEAWPKGSVTRYSDFKVQTASITKLCKTSTVVTVNGMYPGPTIYAREDDRVVVKCPIQAGQRFKYRFALLHQRGTLFWHAHISWLRATVHGPLIIYPKQGASYPFEPPVEEHVIILGEYWLRDIQDLERHVKESGGGPPGSDAYILNGHPALNMEHFFGVANHSMTVVEMDGEYTKPFKTSFLMLTPGETYNVLIKADQPIGNYYMAMAPYMPAKNVPFLNKTSYAILNYVKHTNSNAPPTVKVDKLAPEPILPNFVFAIGLNVFSCDSPDHDRFQGPNGGIFAASVNYVTFRRQMVSLLNAHYNNLEGCYSTHFPDKPEKMYDFVNEAPNNIGVDTQPAIGTQVSVLEYGWAVQVIFQDTGIVATENHPMHLHGFSFYLLGTGLGNFNSSTAILYFYDPPYRNTVGVPVGGWAVIRFRADNSVEFAS